jgi:hypothetical protein
VQRVLSRCMRRQSQKNLEEWPRQVGAEGGATLSLPAAVLQLRGCNGDVGAGAAEMWGTRRRRRGWMDLPLGYWQAPASGGPMCQWVNLPSPRLCNQVPSHGGLFFVSKKVLPRCFQI